MQLTKDHRRTLLNQLAIAEKEKEGYSEMLGSKEAISNIEYREYVEMMHYIAIRRAVQISNDLIENEIDY